MVKLSFCISLFIFLFIQILFFGCYVVTTESSNSTDISNTQSVNFTSTLQINATTDQNSEKSLLTSIREQLNVIKASFNSFFEIIPSPVNTFDTLKSAKETTRDQIRKVLLYFKDWVKGSNQVLEKYFNKQVGLYREYPKKIALMPLRALLNIANNIVEEAEKKVEQYF